MIKFALVLITLLFTTNSFAYSSDDYIRVSQPVKDAYQLVHEYTYWRVSSEVWEAVDRHICHKCKKGWQREFGERVGEAAKSKMYREASAYSRGIGVSFESALLKIYDACSSQETPEALKFLGIDVDAMFYEYRRKNERK